MLKGAALKQIEMNPLRTGRHSKKASFIPLCTRNKYLHSCLFFITDVYRETPVRYLILITTFLTADTESGFFHTVYTTNTFALTAMPRSGVGNAPDTKARGLELDTKSGHKL